MGSVAQAISHQCSQQLTLLNLQTANHRELPFLQESNSHFEANRFYLMPSSMKGQLHPDQDVSSILVCLK